MANKYGRFCNLHTIEINAPADAIWREIENFNNWPNWNPLYPEAHGTFSVGNTVDFAVALPGMSQHQGQATVLTVDKGRLVEYQTVGMGGLAAPLLYLLLGGKVCQGLQGMNEALKTRLGSRGTDL